jgi:hypothetical protein
VAKGFSQQQGIDYNEVWAPASAMKTLRLFLAMVAYHDMEMHQLDVKTAFLHGDVEEELYMQQPPGYGHGDLVCRLCRALHGFKPGSRHAPRQWYVKLRDFLQDQGFVVSASEARCKQMVIVHTS